MYKCKNCGGDLVLNIAMQQLKCPFCDSVFPVSEYENAKEVKEQETYETTIYTCTQCGAEIMTTDNTAVTFCSYCGTEANLQGRLAREKRPKYIIPFKQTKEQCKAIYSENVKKQPYAPKEFTSPEYLENFRGIYIPYWEINVGFGKNPELEVTEEYTSGGYDYTDEYNDNYDSNFYYHDDNYDTYYNDEHYKTDISYVDVVSGCFFMVDSKFLMDNNYFDENTFLYYEEQIFAKKVMNENKKEAIDNKVTIRR